MNKKTNKSYIKSIVLTGVILSSYTQTSVASKKLENLKTIFALSSTFFGLTSIGSDIIKSLKPTTAYIKTQKNILEKTDFLDGKYTRGVLLSQI